MAGCSEKSLAIRVEILKAHYWVERTVVNCDIIMPSMLEYEPKSSRCECKNNLLSPN
jgi:hypothetical protein